MLVVVGIRDLCAEVGARMESCIVPSGVNDDDATVAVLCSMWSNEAVTCESEMSVGLCGRDAPRIALQAAHVQARRVCLSFRRVINTSMRLTSSSALQRQLEVTSSLRTRSDYSIRKHLAGEL